jgi:hypothetical protein
MCGQIEMSTTGAGYLDALTGRVVDSCVPSLGCEHQVGHDIVGLIFVFVVDLLLWI